MNLGTILIKKESSSVAFDTFSLKKTSSPQSPILKLLESPLMYSSFPQAVTLMKKSGESLMVKPKVNLSTPISEIQKHRFS